MYTIYKIVRHNRVILEHIEDYYLNASEMKSVVDGYSYAIFAQAPLKNGFGNFWEACYHLKIRTIFMLCAFIDQKRGVCIIKVSDKHNLIYPQRDSHLSLEALQSAAIVSSKLAKNSQELL